MRSFFKDIPDDEWEKLKHKAAEYDARELEHAHGLDFPLTGARLLEIVKAEKANIKDTPEEKKPLAPK